MDRDGQDVVVVHLLGHVGVDPGVHDDVDLRVHGDVDLRVHVDVDLGLHVDVDLGVDEISLFVSAMM